MVAATSWSRGNTFNRATASDERSQKKEAAILSCAAEPQVLPDVGRWEYMGAVPLQGETVQLWQLKEK